MHLLIETTKPSKLYKQKCKKCVSTEAQCKIKHESEVNLKNVGMLLTGLNESLVMTLINLILIKIGCFSGYSPPQLSIHQLMICCVKG